MLTGMYMHDWSPFYSPYAAGLWGVFVPLLIVAALWTVVLKGYSLWYAARDGQKWWFIALLVVNTLGILEIIYLLFFRPSAPYKHVVEDVKKNAPPVGSSSPTA
jgi:hypothetical protein